MKVAFLFNFLPEIGGGHFKRCSNLALKLKKHGAEVLFIANKNNIIKKFAKEKNIQIFSLENKKNYLKNKEIIAVLRKIENLDLVIIDDYKSSNREEKLFSKHSKKILVIDDLNKNKHYCDYYLNYSPSIKKENVKLIKNNTITYLGLDYFILDDVYKTKEIKINKNIKNILIFLSYTDHRNLTGKLLKIFSQKKFDKYQFHIVLGINKENLFNNYKKKNFKFYYGVKNLYDLLKKMDLALGSGGTNLWERFFMQIPSIAFQIAKNQKNNIDFLLKRKCILKSKNFKKKNVEDIFDKLLKNKNFYLNNIKENQYLLDKFGSDRIIFGLTNPSLNKLRIENFNSIDKNFLFKLANDELNRKFSFNPKKIKYSDHLEWFKKRSKSKETKIFLLKYKNLQLGQIRFEKKRNFFEIDYSIDKPFRGFGMGNYIVNTTLLNVRKKLDFKKKDIVAYVNNSNIASYKIFKNLNFKIEFVNKDFTKFVLPKIKL